MLHLRFTLVPRLLAALIAFHLLAGVPLCREWTGGFDPPAAELAAASRADGGEHGHHEHQAGGHVECPDTFLSSAPQTLPVQALAGRTQAQPSQPAPFPSYEVPTPVPIAFSGCTPGFV